MHNALHGNSRIRRVLVLLMTIAPGRVPAYVPWRVATWRVSPWRMTTSRVVAARRREAAVGGAAATALAAALAHFLSFVSGLNLRRSPLLVFLLLCSGFARVLEALGAEGLVVRVGAPREAAVAAHHRLGRLEPSLNLARPGGLRVLCFPVCRWLA